MKIDKFIYAEIDGERVAFDNPEYEDYASDRRYQIKLEKSGIPDFYHSIDFKDYKGTKESTEFKRIKHYADNCYKEEFNHVNLYLWGKHGVQKSSLLCNILKQCIRNNMSVKFILAGNLIDKLMKLQGFSHDRDLYKEIQSLKEYDIIAIDDIFDPEKTLIWKKSENNSLIITEWDRFLRDVLSSKTKIIMTSNYGKDNIEQYFGRSIFELIDRNFVPMHLTESVTEIRKYDLESVFKDI